MLIIFFDIDGVLNTFYEQDKDIPLNDKCLDSFSNFINHIKQNTDVKLILSSSWRKGWISRNNKNNSDKIKKLEEELDKRNINIDYKTIFLGHGYREQEIKDTLIYMKKHGYIDDDYQYLVIDDNPNEFTTIDLNHLYLTNSRIGFTDRDAYIIYTDILVRYYITIPGINESMIDVYKESELSSEDRKNLNTNTFGLPDERKYPLNDKAHVSNAITYFNKCPEDKKAELARNINKAIKKFNMSPNVSENNSFYKFYKK